MKTSISLLLTGATLSLFASASYAKAEVEIIWENPTEYRDVKPTMQSRTKFREQTLEQLEEYLIELAEDLPDGYGLSYKVTNLDLAGEVWPASFAGFGHSSNDVRVVKSIDIPRMDFSYVLKDAQGLVLQESAEVKLKDMSFMDRHNAFFKNENLRYEKNMLQDWFKTEFSKLLEKN
ncbi:DUF3016 domain-containing protein [Aliiglaciecola sp. LCG003]|uniref:DUF3016 domain-containing protein n=1 Tax=Aliiglaciecola sp. LCG003 TaxID=3053655 RepID=UPI0025729E47|nr:DUF3016 domain-containing protein [Aliiglaciecola sp. LCG003]WJG08792.1 DUF3016 domain-containing protein [Aliiglaciecola sp. LCG003]